MAFISSFNQYADRKLRNTDAGKKNTRQAENIMERSRWLTMRIKNKENKAYYAGKGPGRGETIL